MWKKWSNRNMMGLNIATEQCFIFRNSWQELSAIIWELSSGKCWGGTGSAVSHKYNAAMERLTLIWDVAEKTFLLKLGGYYYCCRQWGSESPYRNLCYRFQKPRYYDWIHSCNGWGERCLREQKVCSIRGNPQIAILSKTVLKILCRSKRLFQFFQYYVAVIATSFCPHA